MPKNDAELMRHMINLTESRVGAAESLEENMFADLAKGLAKAPGALKRGIGNVVGTAAGKGRVERAKASGQIQKMFRTAVARSGEDPSTMKWKTVLNFMINRNVASALGLKPTDALTSTEVSNIIKDAGLRNKLIRKVPDLDNVMPRNILPLKDEVIADLIPGADPKAKNAQIVAITSALLDTMTTLLLDKSGDSESFDDTPAASAPTADNIINTMATLVGSTPDQIKQHLRAAGLVIPESIVDVKTPLLEYMNRTLNKDK